MTLDLFTDAPYGGHPGYQRTKTSIEAARRMTRAETLREKVLEALKERPMTPDECAEVLGEKWWTIRPRFTELKDMQKIRETGSVRANESGRNAAVCEVVNG